MQATGAEVVLDSAPRNRPDHKALQPRRIEEAAISEASGTGCWRIRSEQHSTRSNQVACFESEEFFNAQRSPRGNDLFRLCGWFVHGCSKKRRVDRANARTRNDIDRQRPPDLLREVGPDVVDDARFIGAARATAREDESDLWSSRPQDPYCRVGWPGSATLC